ncbi:MAG: hypothetical protein F4213_03985 [Boseongicola sp. SB0677_bin_26]|nr:hypothetical protein [Boseongicola sp. SB0677_bin_26]
MSQSTVLSLARPREPNLSIWIDASCSFPDFVADFKVPATGLAENSRALAFIIDDAAFGTNEDSRQWIIEDELCAGPPNWDEAGATFNDSVHDCETMKIRFLNAGHGALASTGGTLSVGTSAE